jgi:DNA-binding Lrp family transcriptional regulator
VVDAYILVQAEVGKAAEVARQSEGLKGVTAANAVTGPYDVVVVAEARNLDELSRLIVVRIQEISGVTRTLTCPVIRL